MRQLDKTDQAIVSHLQYDGRKPYTEIAAELGVSEGAVRRRVKRMTDQGALQIVGIVEPQLLQWNAAGMVGVSVHAGQVEAVGEQIPRSWNPSRIASTLRSWTKPSIKLSRLRGQALQRSHDQSNQIRLGHRPSSPGPSSMR